MNTILTIDPHHSAPPPDGLQKTRVVLVPGNFAFSDLIVRTGGSLVRLIDKQFINSMSVTQLTRGVHVAVEVFVLAGVCRRVDSVEIVPDQISFPRRIAFMGVNHHWLLSAVRFAYSAWLNEVAP
jgi:hypothetical protein